MSAAVVSVALGCRCGLVVVGGLLWIGRYVSVGVSWLLWVAVSVGCSVVVGCCVDWSLQACCCGLAAVTRNVIQMTC